MIDIYAAALAANGRFRHSGAPPALRSADLLRLAAGPAAILAAVALLSAAAPIPPDGSPHALHRPREPTVRLEVVPIRSGPSASGPGLKFEP